MPKFLFGMPIQDWYIGFAVAAVIVVISLVQTYIRANRSFEDELNKED